MSNGDEGGSLLVSRLPLPLFALVQLMGLWLCWAGNADTNGEKSESVEKSV